MVVLHIDMGYLVTLRPTGAVAAPCHAPRPPPLTPPPCPAHTITMPSSNVTAPGSGQADNARHVIVCHLTQDTRVRNSLTWQHMGLADRRRCWWLAMYCSADPVGGVSVPPTGSALRHIILVHLSLVASSNDAASGVPGRVRRAGVDRVGGASSYLLDRRRRPCSAANSLVSVVGRRYLRQMGCSTSSTESRSCRAHCHRRRRRRAIRSRRLRRRCARLRLACRRARRRRACRRRRPREHEPRGEDSGGATAGFLRVRRDDLLAPQTLTAARRVLRMGLAGPGPNTINHDFILLLLLFSTSFRLVHIRSIHVSLCFPLRHCLHACMGISSLSVLSSSYPCALRAPSAPASS